VRAVASTGASQEITAKETSDFGADAASWGCSSARVSVRQQPIFVMSPQLPCMERQQALSSRFIALPVMQANKGAAVVSRMKIATRLAKRRMLGSVYALSNGKLSQTALIDTTLASRNALTSRMGGWPKKRLYSRLN